MNTVFTTFKHASFSHLLGVLLVTSSLLASGQPPNGVTFANGTCATHTECLTLTDVLHYCKKDDPREAYGRCAFWDSNDRPEVSCSLHRHCWDLPTSGFYCEPSSRTCTVLPDPVPDIMCTSHSECLGIGGRDAPFYCRPINISFSRCEEFSTTQVPCISHESCEDLPGTSVGSYCRQVTPTLNVCHSCMYCYDEPGFNDSFDGRCPPVCTDDRRGRWPWETPCRTHSDCDTEFSGHVRELSYCHGDSFSPAGDHCVSCSFCRDLSHCMSRYPPVEFQPLPHKCFSECSVHSDCPDFINSTGGVEMQYCERRYLANLTADIPAVNHCQRCKYCNTVEPTLAVGGECPEYCGASWSSTFLLISALPWLVLTITAVSI